MPYRSGIGAGCHARRTQLGQLLLYGGVQIAAASTLLRCSDRRQL